MEVNFIMSVIKLPIKENIFIPKFNNLVIFMTNKNIPHGFTKVYKRISLNLYYYSKNTFNIN